MATLWTFGDSLTESYNIKYDWSRKYVEWKGYVPKVYGDVISERLNLNLSNLGAGGTDNYSIFQNFCEVSHKIKKDDVVIFGWSSPLRFRLPRNDNRWEVFLPNFTKNLTDVDGISMNTVQEILSNRDSIKFVEEVNSWINLIDVFLKDIKHVHWTAFDNRLKAQLPKNLETIEDETNGFIVDRHFSEKGQLDLSEVLIYFLNAKKNNTLI
jgi:hypothetical protein